MIDAARKPFEPVSCLSGHACEDLRDRASDVESSHQTVESKAQPSDHFAKASLRKPPHQLHLSETQMRMDDAKGGGEIVIRLRFDEGDLVIVPENRHGPGYRRVFERQHCQTLFQ